MKFLEKYNHKKNIRYPFLKGSRDCFRKKIKNFVETGTSRGKEKFFFKNELKDGMSTLMFADFAHNINGELHVVIFHKVILTMQLVLQKILKKYLFLRM